ncbi:MAG TPA: YciI family protein [Actinospica sp.]|nr:YciI family protein [Actinospica sp.]
MAGSDERRATADERHSGAQKVYYICFTDPVDASPDEMRPYVEEHKAWIAGVEASGMLFLGGPLLDDDFRFSGSGMMILRASSAREAREVMDADPFHAKGIRAYRLVPWQLNEGSLSLTAVLSAGTLSFE